MTISINQHAVQQNDAYETFLFTCGSYTFRYTSYHDDVTVDGALYEHIAIHRGGVSRTIGATPNQATITLPLSCGVVTRLRQESGEVVNLQVIRRFIGDATTEYALLFEGMLSEWSAEKQEVKMVFKDRRIYFARSIATVRAQCACNNVLYDSVCNVSKTDYTVTADIIEIGISGGGVLIGATYLKLADNTPDSFGEHFSDKADDYFTYGQMCAPDDTFRTIVSHEAISGLIYLHAPYGVLAVGDTLQLAPGCDKSGDTCRTKFNNITRFVGMPYIPSRNPWLYGIAETSE